jgi:hypothetical protein
MEIDIVQRGDRAEVFRDSPGFQDFQTLIHFGSIYRLGSK